MLRDVVVLALPGVAPFELGVVCEVFGTDRSADGLPAFDFSVVTPAPGRVPTASGFDLVVDEGLERAARADLVCVPAAEMDRAVDPSVLALLRRTVERGARVLSVCSGAFVLAEAGVLDGRRCTTHWYHLAEFESRYPQLDTVCDVLYVQDGPVVTSAGTASGIDACLQIVRDEFGAAAANGIARRMVVPPHRDGGQAQYIDNPVPEVDADTLAPLLDWMREHLGQTVSVDDLARRAHLSPRTFARRFRAETGTTPHQWLTQQRLHYAEQLLEQTHEPVERVATMAGFGSATVLRHHFVRRRGTSPQSYRRAFRRGNDAPHERSR
ncbi:MAG: helix-turn-helix domain-containing protein [Actinomycetota bacterium]|nr:helix-turn-helix domain-containing protein [Actinomycetota bacterium]MDH4353037.1 helix-turn-helix domain-containing protein [Actinomycetota bacterium]MDH5278476.1 helix-turn-helix domain-containing protein [Actinomycetota bacterium]